MSSKNAPGSVHVNPNFKTAIHVNPKFIQSTVNESKPRKIHVNPNFIPKCQIVPPSAKLDAPLVCTRTKLVRNVNVPAPAGSVTKPAVEGSLKKIGLRKLVRRKVNPPAVPPVLRDRVSKFKVIRNRAHGANQPSRLIASRFRLKRVPLGLHLTPGKAVQVSKYRLRRNLKKESPNKVPRSLFIHGQRFLVTGNGNRLQRAPEEQIPTTDQPRKRIDIGGLTFVANSDKGTFERTNSHLVRNYLR